MSAVGSGLCPSSIGGALLLIATSEGNIAGLQFIVIGAGANLSGSRFGSVG